MGQIKKMRKYKQNLSVVRIELVRNAQKVFPSVQALEEDFFRRQPRCSLRQESRTSPRSNLRRTPTLYQRRNVHKLRIHQVD